MAPLSPGIVPGAQFDDGAGLRVARHVDIVEPEMVGATIDAIANGIGAAFEFIINPATHQTDPDRIDRERWVAREAGHGTWTRVVWGRGLEAGSADCEVRSMK